MTGGNKPGDASADKWRERFEHNRQKSESALTRLEVRADMKSKGEDEISSVIDERTLEAQRRKMSDPPGKDKLWAIPVVIVRRVSPTALAWLAALALILGTIIYILTKVAR
jgi:hypothetical protein